MTRPSLPNFGDSLGQYIICDEIGSGAMGTVFLAIHERLSSQVAIKILLPEITSDQELVQRFQREAEFAAKLRHPNIVRVFDQGECDGLFYIAMDYLGPVSLEQFLADQKGPLGQQESIGLILQLLAALEHAHDQGVIHRDVKPANVLLPSPGTVVLTDFSIAYMKSAAPLTQTGTALGTPEYMAPEQFEGFADSQADLYSVGVILYEMLTAVKPFRRPTLPEVLRAQLMHDPPPVTTLVAGIAEELSMIVSQALAKDRKQRFGTATEMISALAAIGPVTTNQMKLRILAGPFAGHEISLDDGPVSIGRDARQCQLVIPAEFSGISKCHCRLNLAAAPDGVSVALQDCHSANGTYLDSGVPIPPGRQVLLQAGDRFYLSDRNVMFEIC